MSRITLTKQLTTPPTPNADDVRVYIGSDGLLKSVDESGIVSSYSAGVTPEAVQDIVGSMAFSTASVQSTYNDASDRMEYDVIPSGVDHDSLGNFVANEHIDHSTVNINAGTGLTGGGDITATRTISMPNVGTPGTFRSVTTDAQGRVTAGTNPTTLAGYGITDAQPLDSDLTAIAALSVNGLITRTGAGAATVRTITAGTGITVSNGDGVAGDPTINSSITQYTDEQAQDAVGAILTDTSSVDLTYNDAANQITATVLPTGVNHDALQNFVANEHIDHSSVSINAGTGLTGGGDITATRTISMPNTGTPGTFRSVTTDAQGRVTAGTNPTTLAGYGITDAQPLDSDLTAIAGLAGIGLITRTATGTATTRSVDAGAGLTSSNSDGLTGNPTISMPNVGTASTYGSASSVPVITTDAQGRVSGVTPTAITPVAIGAQPVDTDLTAIASLATTGLIVRTGAGTATTRSVAVGSGLSVLNGDGVAGNPTLSMPNVGTAGTYGTATTYPIITTDAQGRVTNVTTQLVSAIFGSEAEDFQDLTTATTTSTTFSAGASFVTAVKSVGRFRIGFFFNWSISVTNSDARFRITVNGVQVGPESRVEVREAANQSNWESGFVYYDIASSQSLTVAVEFAAETAGVTVSLFQSRVEIWRVS